MTNSAMHLMARKDVEKKIHRRANVVAKSHQSWDGAMSEVVPGGMTQLKQIYSLYKVENK
ncbi:hypothetical protein J6590_044519 [Homalodisca vitripennis]|nr:hypothetical protein J6590_106118 [Homalodisca vitripennis]KAG8311372.1 hypothetical protein J6590_044519 [Homalodisca vitripennis]